MITMKDIVVRAFPWALLHGCRGDRVTLLHGSGSDCRRECCRRKGKPVHDLSLALPAVQFGRPHQPQMSRQGGSTEIPETEAADLCRRNCYIDPRIETAEEVPNRVLEAPGYMPVEQLGSTNDCGFAPFSDDTSTNRTVFAKIETRVMGTELAEKLIGVHRL
jgi:hypothetical protein